jgi:hypothetical protein
LPGLGSEINPLDEDNPKISGGPPRRALPHQGQGMVQVEVIHNLGFDGFRIFHDLSMQERPPIIITGLRPPLFFPADTTIK